ncbi:hypothetical protein SAMN05216521_10561 [Enterocloster clostridioformis]|uniref:MFS transporter n=2 Tax=Enterocloster clostridioformis TaxID=1531 RepID=A0A1I0JFB4_9FIRM|nr:hypothetical protein HMPREF9467_04053 [ [[Clostridium] clostridioforme 2_1_49FAA]QIX91070.1 MFS transporter [Enterocloster clostridioformis]SEU08670.1 hypothetical protein SAMN05216521_10561 [Enterocloster clostridioformis]SEW45733.1 hypothetical protein SAMN05216528_105436 [Enterocloster clostridioformis]SFG17725.1 hypothetical protein SAMN05660211_02139 [Enterocloster clostridioformis]
MATIPIVLWIGRKSKNIISTEALAEQADGTRMEILKDAFKDSVYRRSFIGFFTRGIPETAASLVMTVYEIPTMIGAMATGFLLIKFKMKNVLGSVYGTRVLISLFMLLFPKGLAFAIIITGFLGITGDSTVPPTAGLITKQFGAFFSSWPGGCCFTTYGSYTLPWVVNTVLA